MVDVRTDVMTQTQTGVLSRRTALRRIGAGGAAALLAAEGVRRAAAQEATEEAGSDIVAAWIDAWNSDDPAANLEDLYTDDGIYEDVPADLRSEPGLIADFITPFVDGLSDIGFELTDSFATDDWAAAEYTFSATNAGAFGDATGSFTVRIATIFELEDDAISRSSDYYDVVTIFNQLTPAATPEAGATEAPEETVPAETEPAGTEPAGTPEA